MSSRVWCRAGILTTTTPGLFSIGGFAGFVAFFFLGLFVGTALFGFVADRLGRRIIFTGSLLWYAAASLVMAFQQDALHWIIWRFLCGIGIGVELVTIDTYIAELAPPGSRGRAFAYANIIQFTGHSAGGVSGLVAGAAHDLWAGWLALCGDGGIGGRGAGLVCARAPAGKPALAGQPRPQPGSRRDCRSLGSGSTAGRCRTGPPKPQPVEAGQRARSGKSGGRPIWAAPSC